jgi:hypothetical protein
MDLALPTDFKEFLKLLRAERVEYLLVGGWAVIYYGYPRPTNDFDIWIRVSHDNADRLVRVLGKFGFDVPIPVETFLQEDKIIRLGNEPNFIELMTSVSGVKFDVCYRERLETTLDGEPVSLISLLMLRTNKREAGRLKDLADLEQLPEAE